MTVNSRIIGITALGGLFLIVSLTLYFHVLSPQRELDRALMELGTVEIGKTQLPDLRTRIADAHFANWKVVCDQQRCSALSRIENTFLHQLHLAPKTVVAPEIEFKNGVASKIHIWVEILSSPNVAGAMYRTIGATVYQAADTGNCNAHYSADIRVRGAERWAIVTMGPCVTLQDRSKAFAINRRCLTRIGGCKSGEQILPKVFGTS